MLLKIWATAILALLAVTVLAFIYGMIYYPTVSTVDVVHYGFFWVMISGMVGAVLTMIAGAIVTVWMLVK